MELLSVSGQSEDAIESLAQVLDLSRWAWTATDVFRDRVSERIPDCCSGFQPGKPRFSASPDEQKAFPK
jgi:hypothetical protein